jgi:hypothetical protein
MISWGDIGGKRKPSRFTPVSPTADSQPRSKVTTHSSRPVGYINSESSSDDEELAQAPTK